MAPATRRPIPVWALVSAAWLGPAILAAFQAYVQGRIGSREPATVRTLLWEGGDWSSERWQLGQPPSATATSSTPALRGQPEVSVSSSSNAAMVPVPIGGPSSARVLSLRSASA